MTRSITLLVAAISAASLFAAEVSAQQLFGQRTLGQPLVRQPGTSTTNPAQAAQGAQAARSMANSFSLSPSKSTAGEKTGSLVSEKARFKRGNRKATDFVGSDSKEAKRFVGSEQAGAETEAAKTIRSAIENLDIETAPDANLTAKPVLPPRVKMNPPRLQLALDVGGAGERQVDSRLTSGSGKSLRAGSSDRGTASGGAVEGPVNSQLTGRLEKALPGGSSNRIAVSVAGSAAIVRGAVASERDRKLAELMLMFEPGIDRVQNLLEVRPADEPKPLPTPPAPTD